MTQNKIPLASFNRKQSYSRTLQLGY